MENTLNSILGKIGVHDLAALKEGLGAMEGTTMETLKWKTKHFFDGNLEQHYAENRTMLPSGNGKNSIFTAIREYELAKEEGSLEDFSAIIYGRGGQRRYYLKGNGFVYCSAKHADKDAAAKAKDLGFLILDNG